MLQIPPNPTQPIIVVMANNKKDMRVMMSEEKHEEWCTMIEELNILLTNMLTMIHDTLLVINSGKQKWSILCQPKDQGGLDIRDLDIQNTALLSKWLYKLLTTDGTWCNTPCL
jgi:hypothetical protein